MKEKKILKQVDILSIKRGDVDKFWPLAHFIIAKALKQCGETHTPMDIKEECQEGTMQMYMAFGSDDGVENKVFMVCVSRLVDYPLKRQLEVVLLGGAKRELWEDNITHYLEQVAVENDCSRIAIMARPGFEKLGKRHDYKIKNYEFVKELV